MEYNLYFFRVAASVIPTLTVAVVFTGKLMDAWKLELDEKTSHVKRQGRIAEYIEGITFVAWLLFASIVGEGAALAAVASLNTHFVYFLLVLVAITFQLTCLGGVVLTQAINRLEKHDSKR